MLEAVHLLLALDLFVVVVAVDARWLTRALEVHYNDLLAAADGSDGDGLRASTPQGYLEKIFQITYALGPMKPDSFGEYVQSLASGQEPASTAVRSQAPSTGAQLPGARQPAPGSDLQAGKHPATQSRAASADPARAGAQPGNGAAAADTSSAPVEAAPRAAAIRAVRISGDEQKLITSLVPLLPTPRIAKRLVNVYRLIKATKSPVELAAFEGQGRPASCLFLLAILFGRPGVGTELLRALQEQVKPFDSPSSTLLEAVQARCTALKAAAVSREQREQRERWLELESVLTPMNPQLTVRECAREPMEIARYSLVTGQEWHSWSRAAGTAPAKAGAARGSHASGDDPMEQAEQAQRTG